MELPTNRAKIGLMVGVGVPFQVQEMEIPSLGCGEVLVKIKYATICASDLHTYYGRRGDGAPCILGHEMVGEVIDLGAGEIEDYYCDPIAVGDRITWSVYAHDATDPQALAGMPQKSNTLYKYGHIDFEPNQELSGGFATHCILKPGTTILRVPSEIPDVIAAPLNCSYATVAGGLRLAGDLVAKRVAVVGVGMLGIVACAMANAKGASKVCAIDIHAERLQRSLNFGATSTMNGQWPKKIIDRAIEELGGFDIIIETSGQPDVIEQYLGKMRIGGKLILLGSVYAQRDFKVNAEQMVRHLWTIQGLHNYIPEDLATAVRFLKKYVDSYPFDSIVHESFHLEDLSQAFERASQGKHLRVGIIPG